MDTPDSPGTLDRIKEAAKEIENTANATATPSAPKAGITRVQVEPPVFRASEYIWLGSRSLVDLAGQATVILFLAFFLLAFFLLRHYMYNTPNDKLLFIGFMWVVLTIVFEFGLGIFVTGASWNKMLNDYNIGQGRIWIFFLVIILITPFIIKHFVSAKNKTLAS